MNIVSKKNGLYIFLSGFLGLILFLFLQANSSATVIIFVLSLVFFHVLLFHFSKHENIWKSTDYLFEAVAILSLIAAVSGLNTSSQYKTQQDVFSKRKLAQVNFIYAVETTIINDCDPLASRSDIWTVTPEPINGECDRIKSFLPQMKFEFDQETGPDNMTSSVDWAFNLLYENTTVDGSWKGIQLQAQEFTKVSKLTEQAIQQRQSMKGDKLIDFSQIDKLYFWHHVLAFLLALKIARISMDIFKK